MIKTFELYTKRGSSFGVHINAAIFFRINLSLEFFEEAPNYLTGI